LNNLLKKPTSSAPISEKKRYTLIASLIYRSQANAKDALAVMFCRLIAIAHKQSKTELASKLNSSKEDTCNIVELFKTIIDDGQSIKEHAEFAKAFFQKIEYSGGFSLLTNKCNDILASHGNEYRIYPQRSPHFVRRQLTLPVGDN
jgi:hypothetical protein